MKGLHCLAVGALVLCSSITEAQTLLSDFSSSVDSWSGTIAGNTPFANGSTTVSQVSESGNGVLSIGDAGFGGGASRAYTGVSSTNGFITIGAKMRIVTDPGTLVGDVAVGAKVGTGAGSQADFAYSKSVGSSSDDSGQSFQQVAVSIRGDSLGTTDIVCAVTPDKADWSVSGGNWTIRLDDVKVASAGTATTLDTFDTTASNWAPNNATNSPWAAGSTSVSWVNDSGNGVVNITDGGFAGAGVGTYTSALPGAGIHTVLADVKIVTDPGTLTGANGGAARIAASAGTTTNAGNLSWSQSFATSSDDSGQAFQTVAVPVVTSGASDLALYVVPDFDATVGTGTWTIRVDNVRVYTNGQVPVQLSGFELY